MNKKDKEIIRITLSIGFISAFLVLFFAVPTSTTDSAPMEKFISMAIKGYGLFSATFFFVYLALTAVRYDHRKEKVLNFTIYSEKISIKKIDSFRSRFYSMGIDFIFGVLGFPVTLAMLRITPHANAWFNFVIFLLAVSLYTGLLIAFLANNRRQVLFIIILILALFIFGNFVELKILTLSKELYEKNSCNSEIKPDYWDRFCIFVSSNDAWEIMKKND